MAMPLSIASISLFGSSVIFYLNMIGNTVSKTVGNYEIKSSYFGFLLSDN